MGPPGVPLPPDIGSTHSSENRTSGSTAPAPEPEPAEPMEVGSVVFASYHDTGLYFQGVVVERRADMHRVVYADGAAEWAPASALVPDSLGAEANVHVRPSYDASFGAAEVGRRLGHVVYVRHASGDEGWVALPQVRFSPNDDGVPRRGDEPYAAPTEGLGTVRLVDYRLQGLRFAAVVTAEREDGALHVVYLDSEGEWVDPRTALPDTLSEGDVVHFRRTWDPPDWVRGRVVTRVGFAFQVELDDGGLAWTSLFRLRVPTAQTRSLEPPASARSVESR